MMALDLDLAIAELGQQRAWDHVHDVQADGPDFFASVLLLLMDLV
jgi:hypothetical protein